MRFVIFHLAIAFLAAVVTHLDAKPPSAQPAHYYAAIDGDPKFVWPERIGDGKYPSAVDFALREDSLAWKLGFEALPLTEMGLQQHLKRQTNDILGSMAAPEKVLQATLHQCKP